MAKSKTTLEVVETTKAKNLVRPQIRMFTRPKNGEEKQPILNPMEELFETSPDQMPTLKAVGFYRINPLKNEWMSYTVTFKGAEVLDIEVGEPNLKQIAEDEAKINFVTKISDIEE